MLAATALWLHASDASAQVVHDDDWRYARGQLAIDTAILAGSPVALPTGLARGLGGGVQWGRCVAWGVRASWASASESSAVWQVRHDEVRLRAAAALQYDVGRTTLAMRLTAGATMVGESRRRQQGMRAGLSGDALETFEAALFPTASVEAVITLRIRGTWALQLAAGPGIVALDQTAAATWTVEIGASWER